MKFSSGLLIIFLIGIGLLSCATEKEKTMKFTGAKGEVKIMTLDPGHFHAALVQKNMYDQVNPLVHIYAPEGPDVDLHLKRINSYNTRADNPTNWELKIYKGPDFFEQMLNQKSGNVMVIAGNNRKKTEFIKRTVDAAIHVLADKPMCIDRTGFELLKQAFASAEQQGVLLYDIMTERYEITTILQKELAAIPTVFGELLPGKPEEPAVTKESVHHFFKFVSGAPLIRPMWYYDVDQQGEGLVDVTTHLVDLVQWECFPEQILDYETDIKIISAKHWPTLITKEQFQASTGASDFPDYLRSRVNDAGLLEAFCNGEMIYTLKGICAKVSVIWNYQAPEGAGDTHFSIMRGSKASVIIRQGKEQNYRPELYVELAPGNSAASEMNAALEQAIASLQRDYPGIALEEQGKIWHVAIPAQYHVGHEAHFGQVTEKYLKFLIDGKLPDWEVPNMIAKYHTTTSALEMARDSK